MSARESIENLWDRATPVAPLLDAYRAEVLGEVTAWLIKEAREFHVSRRKAEREQGDLCAVLASKIARGAVRANNLLMLPQAGFFEHGRTYESDGRTFQCIAIEAFPLSGEPRAIGWYATSSGGWPSVEALDPDDWKHGGWTDVTGEASRG